MIRILIINNDEPMAEKAILLAKRISFNRTMASTMGFNLRFIEDVVSRFGKTLRVTEHLFEEALEILMKYANTEKYSQMTLQIISNVEGERDVIVLAEGSMILLVPFLQEFTILILTSSRVGVNQVRDELLGVITSEKKGKIKSNIMLVSIID